MKKLLATLLLLTILLTAVTPALAFEGEVTPSGLTLTEMEAQIDVLMNEHVGTSTPGAAIVVVHEGEIIFTRGYGYADIENQIPVDPTVTVFEHASISKVFVWVAVMQLVEQGLLDLDADINIYLPDEFVFEKPFTMRDILNHAAGFADILLGIGFDGEQVPNLKDALLDSQSVQLFTPGTVSAYNNWSTALAAFVVSEISGQAFVDFEREHILLPSNMYHTLNLPDWFGNDSFLANQAEGYVRDGDGGFLEQSSAIAHTGLYPAGMLNGTAEDLAAFIKALTPSIGESGPLFEHTETLQTLFSPSSLNPNRPGMYHGLMPFPGAVPGIGHGGNLPGFTTELVVVPELRFGFVLLTNVGHDLTITSAIRQLLLGSPETPTIGSNLPNAQAVEGLFITAGRFSGTFIEFFSFAGMGGLPHAQVSALDENRILFSLGGMGEAVYVQTEPHVFQIYDPSEAPFLALMFQELRFDFEDGVPVHIIVRGIEDYTAFPAGRTMPILIGSLVSVILSIGFFLIAPIVLFILFLIRRKKQRGRTRFDRFSSGFLLSGALLMFNNVVLFLLFGINPIRTAAEVAPFIWINYILAGLAVILFAGSIFTWHTLGEARTKRKVLFVITAVVTAMFIILLWHWNFFVLL